MQKNTGRTACIPGIYFINSRPKTAAITAVFYKMKIPSVNKGISPYGSPGLSIFLTIPGSNDTILRKSALFFHILQYIMRKNTERLICMNQNEIDLLNFENELLRTRRKLNDLIYQISHSEQTPESRSRCQEKIFYLETELTYMNQQFQMLRENQARQANAAAAPPTHVPQTPVQPAMQTQQTARAPLPPRMDGVLPRTTPPVSADFPRQDYEKIFGRSFMGIFASVLIFISLIIFATLMLPHLTDAMKLAGLYLLSFGLLTAGFFLSGKNPANKFYTAVIGWGAGSLYLSLLLSDLYFKVFGDLVLYALILVWAVFVRYLSKLKSLVFYIIGQLGILIATILGTVLCVHDGDAEKFLVLTVFYFISAFVFSNAAPFPPLRQNAARIPEGAAATKTVFGNNLCGHIFRLLNVFILTTAFLFPESFSGPGKAAPEMITIALLLLFLLMEFVLFYREEYECGMAFQILTITASCLFLCLLNRLTEWPQDVFPALVYSLAVILLFYVTFKNAAYRIVSEIFAFLLIWLVCYGSGFLSRHLYMYLTVIPFLLYGGLKKEKTYLYAGIAFVFGFLPLTDGPEHLIMVLLSYGLFCCFASKTDDLPFKLAGYLVLTLAAAMTVSNCCYTFFRQHDISRGFLKADRITFFVIAGLHLALSVFQYLGRQKPVEIMTYAVNGLLMLLGCILLYGRVWQIPVILVTVLLFTVNSRKILQKDVRAGYYVAFKYTLLMVCILGSYEAASYLVSISLLLFAILSIVFGFYKDAVTFRLYGLVLSIVSVIKLIMFDIRYDSTLENAVSFFVCGLLCFVISFLYNRIDHRLKKK